MSKKKCQYGAFPLIHFLNCFFVIRLCTLALDTSIWHVSFDFRFSLFLQRAYTLMRCCTFCLFLLRSYTHFFALTTPLFMIFLFVAKVIVCFLWANGSSSGSKKKIAYVVILLKKNFFTLSRAGIWASRFCCCLLVTFLFSLYSVVFLTFLTLFRIFVSITV